MAKYLDQSGVAYLWKKIDSKYATTAKTEEITGSVHTLETNFNAVSGKVDGIEAGAQVNKIEVVKVNGSALTITDKAVNVEIPAATVTGVKSGEKVISLDGTELQSTLSLAIDKPASGDYSGKTCIVIKGISNQEVARVDASQFVTDGMIDSVEWKSGSDNTILVITWNTDAGKESTEIDFSKFIDTYTAGSGITVNGYQVSAKLAASQQSNMSIVFGDDGGLKVSGLANVTNDKQIKANQSSADEEILVWDGATGDAVKNGGKKISDLATTAVTEAITGNVSQLSGAVQTLTGKVDTIETTFVKSVNGHTGNTVSVTKADLSLDKVDNVKQIAGLSAGTTENHVVVWGADGYSVKDSSYTIATSVPAGAVFTDEHVTSAANHYKQNEAGAGTKSDMEAASGTQVDITSGSVQVVTGLKLDAAGHVDSLICKEVKVDATKDAYLSYAEIDAAITYAEGNDLPYSQPISF